PALLLLGRKLLGRDIEQSAPDTGVGNMRGNPRAHGARAQDHDFFNRSFGHICYVKPVNVVDQIESDWLLRPCRLQKRQTAVNEKRQASVLELPLSYSSNERNQYKEGPHLASRRGWARAGVRVCRTSCAAAGAGAGAHRSRAGRGF